MVFGAGVRLHSGAMQGEHAWREWKQGKGVAGGEDEHVRYHPVKDCHF